jgi:predicted GNAT superfamily acetyltransferase
MNAISYRLDLPPFNARMIDELEALNAGVFDSVAPQYVSWRMANMPDVSAFLALSADKIVGFKVGYAMSQRKYYSWLGGVDRAFRRRGIASALMNQQHRWIATRGYTVVETSANRENIAMAQVNLRHGFSVCGMRVEAARTQVLYSKSLGAES